MIMKKLNILIVEDNPGDQVLIKELLGETNLNINRLFYAEYISEAFDILNKEKINIILLDLNLPDSSKGETVSKMFLSIKQIPVIILSSNYDEVMEFESVKNGVQEFLVKGTFTPTDLERGIRNAYLRVEFERELRDTNIFKSKLFRIISHDLRSPFQALLNYLEFMIDDFETLSKEEIKEYLLNLKDVSNPMFSLVDNLLNWTRIESNRIEFSPKELNVCKVIDECVKLVGLHVKSKAISISINSEVDNIYADEEMLKTVLRNLISNAVKFSNKGGEIKISVTNRNHSNIFQITDNGVGITPDRLRKIFNINTNQSTEGTSNEKGSGLGILLSKEFVELHGGEIRIESELSKGTTVIFSIPTQIK